MDKRHLKAASALLEAAQPKTRALMLAQAIKVMLDQFPDLSNEDKAAGARTYLRSLKLSEAQKAVTSSMVPSAEELADGLDEAYKKAEF